MVQAKLENLDIPCWSFDAVTHLLLTNWILRIVAMVVVFCWVLLFLFVPESFWDRVPRPKSRRSSLLFHHHHHHRSSISHEEASAPSVHESNAEKTELSNLHPGNDASVTAPTSSGAVQTQDAEKEDATNSGGVATRGALLGTNEPDLSLTCMIFCCFEND